MATVCALVITIPKGSGQARCFQLVHAIPPGHFRLTGRIKPRTTPPVRSTPLQGLRRYYEPQRQRVPRRVLGPLRFQPLGVSFHLGRISRAGTVTLDGEVAGEDARQAAIRVAGEVDGVAPVIGRLTATAAHPYGPA